jgi:hypothetical protein
MSDSPAQALIVAANNYIDIQVSRNDFISVVIFGDFVIVWD